MKIYDKFVTTSSPYYFFAKKKAPKKELVCPECGNMTNKLRDHIRKSHYERSVYSALEDERYNYLTDTYSKIYYDKMKYEAMLFHLDLISKMYGHYDHFNIILFQTTLSHVRSMVAYLHSKLMEAEELKTHLGYIYRINHGLPV